MLQLNFQTVPCVWHPKFLQKCTASVPILYYFWNISMIDDCIVMLEETRCGEFFVWGRYGRGLWCYVYNCLFSWIFLILLRDFRPLLSPVKWYRSTICEPAGSKNINFKCFYRIFYGRVRPGENRVKVLLMDRSNLGQKSLYIPIKFLNLNLLTGVQSCYPLNKRHHDAKFL